MGKGERKQPMSRPMGDADPHILGEKVTKNILGRKVLLKYPSLVVLESCLICLLLAPVSCSFRAISSLVRIQVEYNSFRIFTVYVF